MPKDPDILCKACGSRRFRFLFKNRDRMHSLGGPFNFYRCCSCGLAVYRPALGASDLSAYYPKDYYSYEASETCGAPAKKGKSYYLRHPFRAANALFYSKILGQNRDADFTAGQSVMDVGCGDGRYLLEVNKAGCRLTGVDIDADALARLTRRRPDVRTHCGNLWEAGFEGGSFDHIHLSHVVEHVEEADKLLAETARLLKDGGEIRLQIPNTASLTRFLFGRFWIHWDAPRHIYGFSKSNFTRFCEAAGLEVSAVRTLENSFSLLGSLFYVFQSLSRGRRKLGDAAGFWDSEVLKALLFPYCLFVNLLRIGDTAEFILRKKTGSANARH